MVRKFLRFNHILSARVMKLMPNAKDVLNEYGDIVGACIKAIPHARIVDVGGGRHCAFAHHKQEGTRICAVDISPEELEHNYLVEEKHVADATKRLPFDYESVDIVASRAVLEHLKGVPQYIDEARRILRPGGMFITGFPSKHTPGTMLNRLLPNWLARKLLYKFVHASEGRCGFPAYYEYCTPRRFKKILEQKGFKVCEVRKGYFQADYFAFFFPLFLIVAAYDWICWKLDFDKLCSAAIVCAVKLTE